MAGHSHSQLPPAEPDDFGRKAGPIGSLGLIVGVIGIVAAVVLGYFSDANHSLSRFFFAYLVSFGFFLAIALAALLFVMVQYLARAGWSVNVRRVAENIAATLPVLGVLVLPIVASVVMQKGSLYVWAQPAPAHHAGGHGEGGHHEDSTGHTTEGELKKTKSEVQGPTEVEAENARQVNPEPRKLDELTLEKRPFLNPWTFVVFIAAEFLIVAAIATWYRKQSVLQDVDGDYRRTEAMQKVAAPLIIVVFLSLTLAAFHLFMSLDPHWYSTMFGVYFFGSGVVAFFATLIVITRLLQSAGYLKQAVTIEHYHDMGKFMFGFVFFWGYIAFSQYMLLWYANLPETTQWLSRRGASSATVIPEGGREWRGWAIALLLGHFVIPFAGLLSRHIKRNKGLVTFWAVWLLCAHFINMHWIVMPEMLQGFKLGLIDLACFVGVGGVVTWSFVRNAASASIRPLHDPRGLESAEFVNV